jgi:hypothetical protein
MPSDGVPSQEEGCRSSNAPVVAGRGAVSMHGANAWYGMQARTACSSSRSLSPAAPEHSPGFPHSTGRF